MRGDRVKHRTAAVNVETDTSGNLVRDLKLDIQFYCIAKYEPASKSSRKQAPGRKFVVSPLKRLRKQTQRESIINEVTP